MTDAVEPASSPATPAPVEPGPGTGFMLGLFGYLAAAVAFGYVGIFAGGADAGDQLGAGLSVAYILALVASVAVPAAAWRLRRQRRTQMALGLLGGMAVGILLLVVLTVRVFGVMDDVASTCPCEPIIDQVRFVGD